MDERTRYIGVVFERRTKTARPLILVASRDPDREYQLVLVWASRDFLDLVTGVRDTSVVRRWMKSSQLTVLHDPRRSE